MSGLGWFAVAAPPVCTVLGVVIGRAVPSAASLRRHDAAVQAEFERLVDRHVGEMLWGDEQGPGGGGG